MATRYTTITGILKTGGTGYIMIAREAIEDGKRVYHDILPRTMNADLKRLGY